MIFDFELCFLNISNGGKRHQIRVFVPLMWCIALCSDLLAL